MIDESCSVLASIKGMLGIPDEETSFDMVICFHINSALFTLYQLGVFDRPMSIESDAETFIDLLGERPELEGPVRMYLFCRTKIEFDTSTTSAAAIEIYKEKAKEMEWRLNSEIERNSK